MFIPALLSAQGVPVPGVKTATSGWQTGESTPHGGNYQVKAGFQCTWVTDTDLISGTNVKIEGYSFEWNNLGNTQGTIFNVTIERIELKIGGSSATLFTPENAEDQKVLANYHPVRFSSMKFASGTAIQIEMKVFFKATETNPVNGGSVTDDVTATMQVTPWNKALNWQTTVNEKGEVEAGIFKYPAVAQSVGNEMRATFTNLNHEIAVGSPTTAVWTGISVAHESSTVTIPTTHGWIPVPEVHTWDGLWDSTTGLISWEDYLEDRSNGIEDDYPKSNLALFMACWTDLEPSAEIFVAEAAWFGFDGVIWSLVFPESDYGNSYNENDDPPPPFSGTALDYYEVLLQLLSNGMRYDDVVEAAKEESGFCLVRQTSAEPGVFQGALLETRLVNTEVTPGRINYVYITSDEETALTSNGYDLDLWYVVLDPNETRGE